MPTPHGRGLGHLKSSYLTRIMARGSTKRLFGAARHGLTGNVDMSACVDRVRDQGSYECCVGMAFARTTHVRSQMEAGGPDPAGHLYPSELGIYSMAREQDAPDASQPLQDQGSYPGYALLSLENVGVPLERDWDFSPEHLNARLPADLLEKAEAMRVVGAYEIEQVGSDRVDACVQALLEGFAFEMAIQVGENYERADTAVVMPETGQIYGGHSISIVGCASVNGRMAFLNVGSWGTGWGCAHGTFPGGFAWLDQSVIADPRSSDFCVLTVVPGAASSGS